MNAKRTCVGLCWTLMLIAICSCGRTEQSRSSRQPVSFDQIDYPEIVPVVDGGAYVIAQQSLWYVQGNNAKKVTGFPNGEWPREITPAADGGAYMSIDRKGVWRLDRDTAQQVTEVDLLPGPQSAQKLPNHTRALYVLWQREVSKRRNLEADEYERANYSQEE